MARARWSSAKPCSTARRWRSSRGGGPRRPGVRQALLAASDEDLRRGLSRVSEALSPLERELARPASDRESEEDTP